MKNLMNKIVAKVQSMADKAKNSVFHAKNKAPAVESEHR
jgi:hypothetical protein